MRHEIGPIRPWTPSDNSPWKRNRIVDRGVFGERSFRCPDATVPWVISTVDLEARHAHKSVHRCQDGFEAHVAVEPDTGLFTAGELTKATGEDNQRPWSGWPCSTTNRPNSRCWPIRPTGPATRGPASQRPGSPRHQTAAGAGPPSPAGSPRRLHRRRDHRHGHVRARHHPASDRHPLCRRSVLPRLPATAMLHHVQVRTNHADPPTPLANLPALTLARRRSTALPRVRSTRDSTGASQGFGSSQARRAGVSGCRGCVSMTSTVPSWCPSAIMIGAAENGRRKLAPHQWVVDGAWINGGVGNRIRGVGADRRRAQAGSRRLPGG
jgi:hypothetical protein